VGLTVLLCGYERVVLANEIDRLHESGETQLDMWLDILPDLKGSLLPITQSYREKTTKIGSR